MFYSENIYCDFQVRIFCSLLNVFFFFFFYLPFPLQIKGRFCTNPVTYCVVTCGQPNKLDQKAWNIWQAYKWLCFFLLSFLTKMLGIAWPETEGCGGGLGEAHFKWGEGKFRAGSGPSGCPGLILFFFWRKQKWGPNALVCAGGPSTDYNKWMV